MSELICKNYKVSKEVKTLEDVQKVVEWMNKELGLTNENWKETLVKDGNYIVGYVSSNGRLWEDPIKNSANKEMNNLMPPIKRRIKFESRVEMLAESIKFSSKGMSGSELKAKMDELGLEFRKGKNTEDVKKAIKKSHNIKTSFGKTEFELEFLTLHLKLDVVKSVK